VTTSAEYFLAIMIRWPCVTGYGFSWMQAKISLFGWFSPMRVKTTGRAVGLTSYANGEATGFVTPF